MTEEKPFNIHILKFDPKYPFLKYDKQYTVPRSIALDMIEQGMADKADPLIATSGTYGEDSFGRAEKKAKKEEKTEPKKTSLLITEDCMYEQIKTPVGGCFFIKYSFADGSMEIIKEIPGVEPLVPIADEEVTQGHILLPSGIEEYGTEEQLIADIEAHIRKYLDVPEEYLHYAALNILKSWVFERFNSLNYLRVQGEPGTGKSRFLDTIGALHYKPIATSGAASPPAVFRIINKWKPTLLIDEADRKNSDETDDMAKIINQGFEKGRPILRCNPDDKSKVEFFDVYCPKVLATRHVFDDIATESRCMTQIMTGTSRSDIIASLNESFRQEQQVLRNKLLLWRFRNFRRIDPDVGETLDWTDIEPRLKQVNIGFVSLIANDKPYIEKFMQRIRDKQMELRNERSETIEGHIVAACSRLLLNDQPFVAKTIIEVAELTDKNGKYWKPRSIAGYMKTLGFLGTKVRRIEDRTEKVYEYNDAILATLFRKYLTADEFALFDAEVRSKAGKLNSAFHSSYFCYHVTIVTIVCGQGKNGNMQEIGQNVTVTPPHTWDGNNGNTVTKASAAELIKMQTRGDLPHNDPALDRMLDAERDLL